MTSPFLSIEELPVSYYDYTEKAYMRIVLASVQEVMISLNSLQYSLSLSLSLSS